MPKILCIEDETQIRNDLVEELGESGYDVLVARNGAEGISAIIKYHPDLVLCDVTMPDKSGFEVLRELRQNHPELSTIPFVFLTALAGRESIIEGKQLGSDDYLTKPIDYELLMVTIEMHLKKAKQIDAHKGQEIRRLEALLNETREKIGHLKTHDHLTDLIRRSEFLKILQEYFDDDLQAPPELAVMVIDMVGLTDINDVLGYTVRNSIICILVERLRNCVHKHIKSTENTDNEYVLSRLGDSELAVLLIGAEIVSDAERIADSILISLSEPVDCIENNLMISSCIGISKTADEGTRINHLLKHADMACRKAKIDGKNIYYNYDSSWSEKIQKAASFEQELRKALLNNEFELYYQPRIDVRSGNPLGAEALIRWKHPEQGFISPVEFIPVAEATGLIVPIGEWVLRTACEQASAWQNFPHLALDIAVNLSPAQFSQENLVETIATILKETGLSARNLELEITENLLLDDSEKILKVLHSIHELGVSIAIDDFGTGYSSLSYLKQFPADIIKIDLSFVQNILTNPQDAALAGAMIEMGHAHNMAVVAEGIETEEQADYLRLLGCDQFQGYWFSRPLPAKEYFSYIINSQIKKAAAR